jgi:hypothetical protein
MWAMFTCGLWVKPWKRRTTMLDDLRNSVKDSFIDEEPVVEKKIEKPFSNEPKLIFGMSAPQRFIVSVFILLMVFILGLFLLIIFGKVVIPV